MLLLYCDELWKLTETNHSAYDQVAVLQIIVEIKDIKTEFYKKENQNI